MRRLGGPELRLPELGALRDRLSGLRLGRSGGGKAAGLSDRVKAPAFLVDLYWDLRDRHLLPLVALAVVACIAAPILLGGSAKSDAPSPVPGATAGSASEGVEGGGPSLAVAEAEPGLREPSKRLRGRRAQDPFGHHLAGGAHEGAASGRESQAASGAGGGVEGATTIATTTNQAAPETSVGSSGSTGETGTSTPAGGTGGSETGSTGQSPAGDPSPRPSGHKSGSGGGSDGSGSSEGGSGSGSSQQTQISTFAIDVRITKTTTEANGAKSKPEVIEMEHVLPSSALPYKKRQVVTYMGVGPTTEQPLFLVSEAVGSVFGEAKCVAGEGHCQLVELEKGFPVTFVYGENDVRYKVQVLKIEPVTVGHS